MPMSFALMSENPWGPIMIGIEDPGCRMTDASSCFTDSIRHQINRRRWVTGRYSVQRKLPATHRVQCSHAQQMMSLRLTLQQSDWVRSDSLNWKFDQLWWWRVSWKLKICLLFLLPTACPAALLYCLLKMWNVHCSSNNFNVTTSVLQCILIEDECWHEHWKLEVVKALIASHWWLEESVFGLCSRLDTGQFGHRLIPHFSNTWEEPLSACSPREDLRKRPLSPLSVRMLVMTCCHWQKPCFESWIRCHWQKPRSPLALFVFELPLAGAQGVRWITRTIRHPLGISESDGNWYILLLHAWHMLDSVDTDSTLDSRVIGNKIWHKPVHHGTAVAFQISISFESASAFNQFNSVNQAARLSQLLWNDGRHGTCLPDWIIWIYLGICFCGNWI